MMRNYDRQVPTLGDWGDMVKPEDDLRFAPFSREFTHLGCTHGSQPHPVCARTQAPDGSLLSITCMNCRTKWDADLLPLEWTRSSIWLRTNDSSRQDAPLGVSNADPRRAQLTAETLQFHQSAYETSIGGNVSDTGLPSPRRREPRIFRLDARKHRPTHLAMHTVS